MTYQRKTDDVTLVYVASGLPRRYCTDASPMRMRWNRLG